MSSWDTEWEMTPSETQECAESIIAILEDVVKKRKKKKETKKKKKMNKYSNELKKDEK